MPDLTYEELLGSRGTGEGALEVLEGLRMIRGPESPLFRQKSSGDAEPNPRGVARQDVKMGLLGDERNAKDGNLER
jgi:hypothetical protein